MKLELRSRGVQITNRLRKHVEKRLRRSFGRFDERIEKVRVQFTDINGPRGGVDTHCLIQASLSPSGVLIIQETRQDPFTAVAHASSRIAGRLSRHLERRRARRRKR